MASKNTGRTTGEGGKKKGPTSAQQAAFKRLQDLDPNMEYQWDNVTGIPKRLLGKLSPPSSGDPLAIARQFLTEHRALYRLADVDRELEIKSVKRDSMGNTHIRLQQNWQDFPVFGTELIVHVAADNTIRGVNGQYHPTIDAASKPSISADAAMAAARKHAGEASEIPSTKPQLEIFHQEGKYTLCWHVRFDGMEEDRPALWEYFINAENAAVVFRYNNLQFHSSTTGWGRGRYAGCKQLNAYHNHSENTYQLRDTTRLGIEIKTYDMDGSTNRDSLTLSEDSNKRWTNTNRNPRRDSQEAEVDAHYYLGIVVDYFLNILGSNQGHNSYDDAGSDAEVCVHYRNNFDNALWDPNRNRIYIGDGDGVNRDYWSSLGIIAHEFTHGVTCHSAGLNYFQVEPGALHESYSDFFASIIQEDWFFGEHVCLGATAPNDALRSLYDPTLYGDPDHYNNLGVGVHTNSCITSKAGYLMTHGGNHNNIEVYGLGREVAARIWYQALIAHLTPSSNFSDFRAALETACDDLYPGDTWKKASIQNALAAVGIGNAVSYPTCPTLTLGILKCTFQLITLKETIQCALKDEITRGCCTRELILEPEPDCSAGMTIEPKPGCSVGMTIEPTPGPCRTTELILEPATRVVTRGDIPLLRRMGCQKETLIIGRLTEGGRVEPLSLHSGQQNLPLNHVRILTRKSKD